jgi:hypothetical protein
MTNERWNSAARTHNKHVSMAMDMRATTEELLETVFLCGPCQGFIARAIRKLVSQGSEVVSHQSLVSCEMVVSRQRYKHERRRISTAGNCI